MKQILITVIVGDFNTPASYLDRTPKLKTKKDEH